MAATVTLPGGRKVPKVAVIGGVAAVGGVVGYAWWKKGTANIDTPVPVEPQPTGEVPPPTDSTSFSVNTGTAPPMHNSDWEQLAVERLQNIGLDAPAVSSAIGKFLAHKPLTAMEADFVRQAIGAAGYPPEGGPWTVIDQPLPTPVATAAAPGPVRALSVSSSRTQMMAKWSPPNTGGPTSTYHVEFYGGKPGGGTNVVSSFTTGATTQKSAPNMAPNHSYGVRVYAIGANGKHGPTVSHPAILTKK